MGFPNGGSRPHLRQAIPDTVGKLCEMASVSFAKRSAESVLAVDPPAISLRADKRFVVLQQQLTVLSAASPSVSSAMTSLSVGDNSPYVGPDSGHLVIVGGGKLDDSIFQRVVDLAGGNDASIVVIPTAGGEKSYDDNAAGADTFRRLGVKNVKVLHTCDRDIADSDDFAKPLSDARGVWFGGGRQWRLVDSYAGTRTERAFWGVLERGGVIGGTSAGATIQGSFLARGDTQNNQVMMGDHQQGFGFVKNIAIDQHVLARNRQFDMFSIRNAHPELLGIGIDENTALVVSKNEAEVIGASCVLVYDGSFWSREGSDLKKIPDRSSLFYFLRRGDRYDLARRQVAIESTTPQT